MKKKSIIYYSLLTIWPFLFLIPLSSGYVAIGNDFDLIYYSYKKYIFEFWQEGQLPFWAPSEGAGFSLVYNPFAQFFYLPSWLLFIISDLKNSFSLQDYLNYTIFGVSIYSLGQYQWLKNIKFSNNELKYIVTLLVPTMIIITNFLRLPNAIQTICWLPFLLLGINYSINRNKYLKSFFLIFFSSLLIFTAGYPYFIFYILIFSTLYFFFILNFYDVTFKEYPYIFLKNIIPVIISLLISLPWLYGVLKTLTITQDRNINDYAYSTEGGFNFLDIIGSWVYPVISNTEGRYFFGIIISFIIIKFFLDLRYKIYKIHTNEKKIIIFFIICFFVITFLSASETKLFQIFWGNIEFIQNIRTWPRVNILMVPTFSIVLVLAISYFTRSLNYYENKNIKIKYHIVTTNILLSLIFIIQFYFYYSDSFHDYWFVWHEKRFLFAESNLIFPLNFFVMMADGRINLLTTIILILFLNYIFIYNFKLKFKNTYLFIIILGFVSFEQFLNSNLQWGLNEWKTQNTSKTYNAQKKLNINFNKPRIKNEVHGNNYFRDDAFTINNFLNWGNKYHNSIFWVYFDKFGNFNSNLNDQEINDVKTFYALNNKNKKIFFTDNINQDNIFDFVNNSRIFEYKNIYNYKITNFSNNFIEIKFDSKTSGYLSYIDNIDPFWQAFINGKKVKLSILMNSYKSVSFTKGENLVRFSYEPFKY